MGEGIRSSKKAAWDVDDFEIKISEVKQPLCLVMVGVLCLMEVHQVLVVSDDLDVKGGSVEVMPLRLQSIDDGKELPIVDVIVLFCWDERLGEVGIGVPVPVQVSLEEDSAGGIL